MQIDNLEEKVKEIIAKQLIVDSSEIKPESTFIDDLGADSLDMVELNMAFEQAFNIEVLDEDADKVVKVKDAIELIEQMITMSKTPSHRKEKIKQELEQFIVTLENNRVLHDIPNRSHREIRESIINETIEKIVKIYERG